MSSKGGKRPTLRADKRYPAGGTAKKPARKPAPKKAASKAVKRKAAPKRRAGGTRRRGPLGWIAAAFRSLRRLVWGIFWRVTVVCALLLGGAVFYYYLQLPPFSDQIDGRTRGSVTLLDRDGEVFAWRGEQFESITDIDQVSPHLKNAVIAAEDKRF